MKPFLLFIALCVSVLSYAQEKVTSGTASFYANKFNGRKTSSGEIFRQDSLTAAHKNIPFGTYVKVTNLSNDSVVIVKVNDRLPQSSKRSIDLSMAAAKQLNFVQKGLTKVTIEIIDKTQPVNRSPVDTITYLPNDFLYYKASIDSIYAIQHDTIGILKTREVLLAMDTTVVTQNLATYYQYMAGTYFSLNDKRRSFDLRQQAIFYYYKSYYHNSKNGDVLRPLMMALAENKRCGEARKIYSEYLRFTPREKCGDGDAAFMGRLCSD
jgi:rare lipoprotein A (peptidoglycan hydrolase)